MCIFLICLLHQRYHSYLAVAEICYSGYYWLRAWLKSYCRASFVCLLFFFYLMHLRIMCISSLYSHFMFLGNTVQEGVYEGKLQCLNCEARLGSFNWAGIQCSCGTRVTPAFQLHKCNMDSSLRYISSSLFF